MSDELSSKIVRACVEAGVNPAIADSVDPDADCVLFDRLPADCPIPEMQVYRVCRWNATEHSPECWSIMVMLEQQIGSMSYWIPIEITGPNLRRDWQDKSSPQGWKISFWEEASAYADLRSFDYRGWWPTLEEAWEAIPRKYKYYDPAWRRESDCETCHCTGVYLWNLYRLPCPDCRTTPTSLTYGHQHLMWVPAHTKDRRPHAKKGKRWRWKYGTGYVVQNVLGNPDCEWDNVFVGLKRHEAVDNPNWKYGENIRVDAAWADYDFQTAGVQEFCDLVLAHRETRLRPKKKGWLHRVFGKFYFPSDRVTDG